MDYNDGTLLALSLTACGVLGLFDQRKAFLAMAIGFGSIFAWRVFAGVVL